MAKRNQKKKTQPKRTKTPNGKWLRDERTGKIFGALSLLASIYLLIAFVSYLFTWSQDQDKVMKFSFGLLAQSDLTVENWLGRLGAIISNAFFYWGFGVASFCFVFLSGKLGLDLLRRNKNANFWKTFRHTTLVIVFTSITAEFVLSHQPFPWGGAFGESATIWLSSFLGNAGLALLLIFALSAWMIWVFNPSFGNWNLPTPSWARSLFGFDWSFGKLIPSFSFSGNRDMVTESVTGIPNEAEAVAVAESPHNSETLRPHFLELYKNRNEHDEDDDSMDEADHEETQAESQPRRLNTIFNEIVLDYKESHKHDDDEQIVSPAAPPLEVQQTRHDDDDDDDSPESAGEKNEAVEHLNHDPSVSDPERENLDHSEPYDPTAELSRFKTPPLELLQDYSEHKVQIDRAELEANKDQIIETLLNYKIEITKIFATIGPTVTLYEIVPAPGVRISRIKNLEDDIALSLAALGIRIIAPMPGKGTNGI